jgi:hypothetical protein
VWSVSEPGEAWDWYVGRVPDGQRPEAFRVAIKEWTGNLRESTSLPRIERLEEAANWLNLQSGTAGTRDPAATVLAQAWAEEGETEAAVLWARSIAGEEAREVAEKQVMEAIRKKYPKDWQDHLAGTGWEAGK